MTGTQSAPEFFDSPPGYGPGVKVRRTMPEGLGTSGVLAIGEASGHNEDSDGLPFRPYAEAGSVLERALHRAGVPRESLTITNIVAYRPPRDFLDGASWEREAVEFSRPFLEEVLQRVRPKVILAIGGFAFRELTGMSGEKQGIEMCRGFIVPSCYPGIVGLPVIGMIHPSKLRRESKERSKSGPRGKVEAAGGGTGGMALLGTLIRDIQLAVHVAKNGCPKFAPKEFRLGATLEDWEWFAAQCILYPQDLIVNDFETRDSLLAADETEGERVVREPTQIQMSLRSGQAVVSPWTPELLPVLRLIMALENPKGDWYGRYFDRPLWRDLGVPLHGVLHDLCDLHHHAQPDLPRGLQSATSFVAPEIGPWKHLSQSDPLYYGALDVHAPQEIWRKYRPSLACVRHPVSNKSLLDGYEEQVVRLAPVLDRMSERGIPVDEGRRLALDVEFSATLKRLFEELQGLYPSELKGAHVYKKEQKDFVEGGPTTLKVKRGREVMDFTTRWLRKEALKEETCSCVKEARQKVARAKREAKKSGSQMAAVLAKADLECFLCGGEGKVRSRELLWAKEKPFLPGAWQQVLSYIKFKREEEVHALSLKHPREWALQHAKWKVPEDWKTGRETTGEKELRRLMDRTGDGLLKGVLEFREVDKARGTYVLGWKPGPDGRVHPSFGFKPATGQLSSEQPNAQNFYSHGNLAKAMKGMIRTTEDRILVVFDYKSFHVLTLGFEAKDPDYMRAARIDAHSIFALAGLLRLETLEGLFSLSDEELKEKLEWYRAQKTIFPEFGGMTFEEVRNEKAKRALLGIGFGQQENSLWKLNPESFAGPKEARRVLNDLNALFPRPESWRREVKDRADRQGLLIARHGFVRRFYDVLQRKPLAENYQTRNGDRMYTDRNGQRWKMSPGDDAEAAIAFLPANDAFGTIRQAMVRLHESGQAERFGLINQIHDSLIFDCPKELLDGCIWEVKEEMERPNPLLRDPEVAPEGLVCRVDVKAGRDLASMEKIS